MTEPAVAGLMTVQQAIALLDATPVQPRPQRVTLEQAAGHYLSEAIRADRDDPPFDKSLMDGYAVRAGDVQQSGALLKVVGEVAAGESAGRPLATGEAIAIMTGAPLPAGADAVVPVEETLVQGEASVTGFAPVGASIRIQGRAQAGQFIAAQGSNAQRGQEVLPRGMRLGAAQIAVAASAGISELAVFAKPRVAVLSTGNELIPSGQTPRGAQIRGSNGPMLIALLQRLGCDVLDAGIAVDEPGEITRAVRAALTCQALFITGGMSVGEHDYVPRVLQSLGADLKITKLRIKPGKPFVFATMPGGQFVFGLPGNPVSAYVCTLRLASRLLSRLAGATEPTDPLRWLPLAEPLAANGPREFYQPALLREGKAHPLRWIGSADVFTLARASVLIVRPENAASQAIGDWVRVIDLP